MITLRGTCLGVLCAALVGCGGGDVPGGTNDAATAAARIKGGMEAQAGAVQALSTQAAAAAATVPAAATQAAGAIAGAGAAVKGATGMTPDQVGQAAIQEAAKALNVPPGQVTVEKVEPVQWRDASLGCGQPGQVYAQVITPGFRVTVSAGGQRREVHADMSGRMVVCQNPTQ